jgi:hypothetical protein
MGGSVSVALLPITLSAVGYTGPLSTGWPGNGNDNVLRYATGMGPSAPLFGVRATDGGYDHHVVGPLRSHPTSLPGG